MCWIELLDGVRYVESVLPPKVRADQFGRFFMFAITDGHKA